MNIIFEILNEGHSVLLDNFTCIEDDDYFKSRGINKHDRRKIKRHSENINMF